MTLATAEVLTAETRTGTAEVLDDAAALLVRDGWMQGNFGPTHPSHGDGPRCLEGALLCVGRDRYYLALQAAVALIKVIGQRNLALWNDAPERSADEVIEAMHRAATELRLEITQ